MDRRRRRIGLAWALLSVFVSMLLLSGLHRHEAVADAGTDCVECAHHIHHSGHLTIGFDHVDACVLCQFLHFVYTAAVVMVLLPLASLLRASRYFLSARRVGGVLAVRSTRGPPCLL